MCAVEAGVFPKRDCESVKVREPALIITKECLLEAAYSLFAGSMIRFQQIQQFVRLVRAQTDAPEQVAVFLGVMQVLTEKIDVLQHRAEHLVIGRMPACPHRIDEEADRVKYGLDRMVFPADGIQRVAHGILLGDSFRSKYASAAAHVLIPVKRGLIGAD
jgi:hypothetical protein